MSLEDFEMFVISKGLKIEEVDENIINEYFTGWFYAIDNEEDMNAMNDLEDKIRMIYLGE